MAGVSKGGRSSLIDVRAAKILMLAAVLALVTIGIVMVYSATSATLASDGKNPFEDVQKQLVFVGIGVLLMLAIWFAFPYRTWLGVVLVAYYAVCMLLLVLTAFIGTDVNGARRWLYLGSVGFQPSEFIKIALLMMTIRIVYDKRVGKLTMPAAVLQLVVLVGLPLAFLLVTQSDLGTAAICVVGVLAVLYLGGVPGRVMAVVLAGVVAVGLIAIFGVGYRSSRLVFLDPWNDGKGGLGDGFNIIHAYYAIAEGGIFGVGIGSSHEKYDYLFASDSDFIFAIICEELGFVGAVVVIGLFVIVLLCGLKIASECADEFGKMVAGGLVIMLVFQAFLNIGCTIGVFPTTGKPLPFISSGGSSVISSLMIIGLIMSVATETEREQDPARKRDNLRVVRTASRER